MDFQTVKDFRGGIADGYLAVDPAYCSELDNLLIDENGKPYSRYGTSAFDTRIPTSTSNQRISGIIVDSEPYGSPVFVRTDRLYFINESDAWTEVQGPTGNPALPLKTNAILESSAVWQKQVIFASGPTTFVPQRIVCDEFSPARSFYAVTLGLPSNDTFTLASAGGTGNNYIYAAHYTYVFQDYDGTLFEEKGATTRVLIEDVGAPSVNNITLSNLDEIVNGSNDNYDTRTTAYTTIGTTNGSAVLTGFSDTSEILPGYGVTGAGIPTGARVVSTTSTTVTLDRNATATASVTVTTYALTLSVYRTVANGETLFLIATIANGTNSYVDAATDDSIENNVVIYTDGDVLDYNQPPVGSKYVTQVNGFFWYATDRTLTHSIQFSPGASPAEYEQLCDQKIKGLSNNNSFPILFCDRAVYRIDGIFDEFGGEGFDFRVISHTAGCVSNRSIVKIPEGLVWAGNGGFYFTDGNGVRKISHNLPTRYELWKNEFMVGCYDAVANMVRWTIANSASSALAPNNAQAVLHLDFGINDQTCITTLSSANNIYPTALAYSDSQDVPEDWRGRVLMGEARGFFLWEDPLSYTDPKIDFNYSPTTFKKKVIRYRLESAGLDGGIDAARKYCVQVTAEFRNETDIALQFFSRRDDGGPWASLSEMRQDGAILWGISEYGWNDPNDDANHDWNSQSITEGMRHFPTGTLRSTYRQLAITNAKTWITNSDTIGTVTTDPTVGVKSITLNNATQFWPGDCEDYEICFEDDDYTYGYIIKERVSDLEVRVYDPYGTLPTGSTLAWQMRGYRKFERLYLLSYTVWFDTEGPTQPPSRGNVGLVNG